MEAAVEDVDILNLADLLQIADAAPYDGAAALRLLADHGGKIAADERAVLGLIEKVGDKNVVLNQAVHDPLVVHTLHALALSLTHHSKLQILADGNERRRHGAADGRLLRVVRALELTLELIVVQLHPGQTPNFLDAHVAQTLENAVGNAGASVREALAGPIRSHLNDVITVVELHGI